MYSTTNIYNRKTAGSSTRNFFHKLKKSRILLAEHYKTKVNLKQFLVFIIICSRVLAWQAAVVCYCSNVAHVTSSLRFPIGLAWRYTRNVSAPVTYRPPSAYNDRRLSHDLDAFVFFLKIMCSRFLAEMQLTLRARSLWLDFSFSARLLLSRICVTSPTSSSSMLWLSTADTSQYLQSYFMHDVRGSITQPRILKATFYYLNFDLALTGFAATTVFPLDIHFVWRGV